MKFYLKAGPWPRRLAGAPRFIVYLALQFAIFSAPFSWVAAPLAAVMALGLAEGFGWIAWLRRSWPALMAAALPALVGFPLGAFIKLVRQVLQSASSPVASQLVELLHLWEPSLLRGIRLELVLASAAWLSAGMSPVDLRDALTSLLRPLGTKGAGIIARAASLTMACIPWTMTELRRADEAARLRGSNPARRPGRHLVALSVPLVSRTLDKARRGSEALALRDAGFITEK